MWIKKIIKAICSFLAGNAEEATKEKPHSVDTAIPRLIVSENAANKSIKENFSELSLCTTDELIVELFSRADHSIYASRKKLSNSEKIEYEDFEEVGETRYVNYDGDSSICQGLACQVVFNLNVEIERE